MGPSLEKLVKKLELSAQEERRLRRHRAALLCRQRLLGMSFQVLSTRHHCLKEQIRARATFRMSAVVYVHLQVRTQVCVHKCEDQKLTSGVFLSHSTPHFGGRVSHLLSLD